MAQTHLERWSRRFGRPGSSCMTLATVDLPRDYDGKLREGQTLAHQEEILGSPGLDGVRFNLAKGWHLADARDAIERAHARGKIVMVDVVSRLRFESASGTLIRVAPGETLVVSTRPDRQASGLWLNHALDLSRLTVGQTVLIRDQRACGRITEVQPGDSTISMETIWTDTGGPLELLRPPLNLPGFLGWTWEMTQRDESIIELALSSGVDLLAVSFLLGGAQAQCLLDTVRRLLDERSPRSPTAVSPPVLVAKIENEAGVRNLPEILRVLDAYPHGIAVEVARGDLANEVALERLGEAQEACVQYCHQTGVPVGVATGILGTMQRSPQPSRADAGDAWSILRSGASFALLADETANDARYPGEVVATLARMARSARETNGFLTPEAHALFCLAGVPATGKSTLRTELLRRYPHDVVFLSRYTTRRVRSGEEGEIVRLDRETFRHESDLGNLTARYCSNRAMYGISVRELHRLLLGRHSRIGCVSASAGLALRDRGYDVRIVYLTVRNREELVNRLRERGHAEEEIETRMHEFDDADAEWRDLSTHHVIYTDELSVADTVEQVARLLGLLEESRAARTAG